MSPDNSSPPHLLPHPAGRLRRLAEYARRHGRAIAFLVLIVVTVYGVSVFLRGDWRASLAYWEDKGWVLLTALALHASNVAIDAFLWRYVLGQFGVRVPAKLTVPVFVAGLAGLLLPMQLGRFIRSEAVSRLGMGPLRAAVKAELVFLFLCTAAAGILFVSVVGYAMHPALTPVAALGSTAAILFLAERVFVLLAKTPVTLPKGYWLRPDTFLVTLLAAAGWVINATCLYL
ncbi:MAG TPA: hypothetical protein ENN80_04380, partial [Candidatus Hydrogenedentes bacterium]|nr:hypothetical protein [Candidatus Hydrogenedentota bacterium]